MPSELELCNEALALFDQDPISSLSEDSRTAEACARLINPTRRFNLTLHPWYFARKRASLPGSTSPDDKYKYAFNLPADCLQLVHANQDQETRELFDLVGLQALGQESPMKITYIYDMKDYAKMPPWFYDMLTYALAIPLISALTSNYELQNNLRGIHSAKLRNCRWLDTIQGPRHEYEYDHEAGYSNEYIDVRWR